MSNTCRPPRFRCIPGLRFHPTDIELTLYHLKRKFRGKQSQFIADVDIYKHAPWELPAKSCSITKDLAWYFFCLRERKYPNGNRAKRATDSGFWKTTGNDRDIRHEGNIVGKIKTLIFHTRGGRNGVRTNWVMHEYRLIDQDTYVICKVFEKSGVGPKNGAQYGAPFDEEEWNDDEGLDGVVSGPAASLQNIQEKSMMTSTFTPANMCIGSSSEPISYNSVQPTENISTPVFCVAQYGALFEEDGWNDDEEFNSVVSSPLACVSGPAASLQNIQEKSMMTSTFTPTNMCIGSSAQPAENNSTRVFGDVSLFELPGLSLDDLVKPPGASAHDNYGSESMNEVYQGFPNYQSYYSGNQLHEDGMDLSDLRFEEETQNMTAEDVQTNANPQELGTLCKKRKYTGCIEDII